MSSRRRRRAGYAAAVLLLLMVWPSGATANSPAPSGDGIGVSVTVEHGKVDNSKVDNNGLLPDVGGPGVWLLAAASGGVATGVLLLAWPRRRQR